MPQKLNHNEITPAIKRVFKPIKKQVNKLTREALEAVGVTNHLAPSHKFSMTVQNIDELWGVLLTDDSRELEVNMKLNPNASISFTQLADENPDVFTHDLISEFCDYLNNNNFVPDDVQVALSPHSTRGHLSLVVIFDRENYGGERTRTPDARFTRITTDDGEDLVAPAAPVRVSRNPLDLLN